MRVTSAYANKMLKKLNEEKDYWINKEKESMLYTASTDEEPVIPDYDYGEVSAILEQIEKKIYRIKHAINQSNVNSEIEIFGEKYTVDVLLVRMAQIRKRKSVLDRMRKQLPKTRVENGYYMSRKAFVEYRYVNYDLEQVQKDYEEISKVPFEMQIKPDEHNQSVEFHVDIE